MTAIIATVSAFVAFIAGYAIGRIIEKDEKFHIDDDSDWYLVGPDHRSESPAVEIKVFNLN